jgi:protein DJ-1
MKIQADTESVPDEPGEYTIAIIPGGAKGAATLSESKSVQSLLEKFEQQNKYIGTICAGSLAIKSANLVPGGQVTSHPSVAKEFGAYKYSEDRVVVEQRVISSRGYEPCGNSH